MSPKPEAAQPELESPFKPSSQEAPFEKPSNAGSKTLQERSGKDRKVLEEEERAPFFPGEQSLYPSAAQLSLQQQAPNAGRGGATSTSTAAESSRPGGIRFQTQAVGRRFNSSGIAEIGQVSGVFGIGTNY